ncbi:MAG: DUF3084 domain-containing protein [Armatimonadetes bacterium]|nr:MAG: DUF3084 domain-containing protein [Armatimonadota bacterium]
MIASPVLLLLMIVLGGTIAYLGDLLGRKMGKRRLRAWGLRPRHTATLITVLVGAALPVATTFLLATISRDVRSYLVRGPELAREARLLGDQVQSLRQEREEIQARNAQLQKETSDLRAAGDRLAAANRQLEQERSRLLSEVQGLRAQVSGANARLQDANRRLADVEARRAELAKEVKSLQQQIPRLEQQVAQLKEDLQQYEEDTVRLAQEAVQAEQQRDEALKARDEAQARRDALYAEITDLQATLVRMRQDMSELIRGIEAVRTSDVLFHRNEELARLPIPGGLARPQAEIMLNQVLRMADVRARERGVLPDAQGRAAAMIDWQRLVGQSPPITITVQDQKDSLFEAIRSTREDLVILARAHYNYFSVDSGRRPVPLRIDVFLNRVVYREGDVIATTVLDGSLDEDSLVDSVMEFLNTDVRRQAEEAGMIPVHGFVSSLGEVTFEQMVNLVREVRQKGGQVTVVAVADATTRSAEVLRIRFEVRAK